MNELENIKSDIIYTVYKFSVNYRYDRDTRNKLKALVKALEEKRNILDYHDFVDFYNEEWCKIGQFC